MPLAFNVRRLVPWLALTAVVLALGACALRQTGFVGRTVTVDLPAGDGGSELTDLRLVTLLPKDAIPAIFNPSFVDAAEGNNQLRDEDLVLGVSINGDTRAYGVANLSSHEIVNDTVGGAAIAVTW